MSTVDIIKSILELAAVIFVVWGLFHEEKFVVFEDRIKAHIRRRRFKVVKGRAGTAGIKTDYPMRKSV